MIELPLGTFVIGAPPDEYPRGVVFYDDALRTATKEHPSLKEDEGPMHEVIIDVPIAIGKNEVTFAEWMACVDDGGCDGYLPGNEIPRVGEASAIMASLDDARFGSTGYRNSIAKVITDESRLTLSGSYPVVYVSFYDAQNYIDWLNKKLGTTSYRLPTEAEWEYAARAGTKTRFPQGDNVTPAQANFSGETSEFIHRRLFPDFITRGFPIPVDELDAANAWGVRHMSGNVSEITLSCYSRRYHGWTKSSEWLTKGQVKACERSIRGGSYASSIDVLRSAWRMGGDQSVRAQRDGFRIVKELRPQKYDTQSSNRRVRFSAPPEHPPGPPPHTQPNTPLHPDSPVAVNAAPPRAGEDVGKTRGRRPAPLAPAR